MAFRPRVGRGSGSFDGPIGSGTSAGKRTRTQSLEGPADVGGTGGRDQHAQPHDQRGPRDPHDPHGRPGQQGQQETGPGAPPHEGANDIHVHTTIEASGHRRRTVGCGEEVTFTLAHGGTWTASTGTPVTGSGPSFVWRAPAVGGTATITCDRGNGQRATVDMHVVAPQSVSFRKLYDLPQTPAGAGMRTNLTFNPTTVSFANLEWHENGDGAAAAPQNVSGWFETHRTVHAQPLLHVPATEWVPMGEDNQGADDTAHIRNLQPISSGGLNANTGYWGGHFEWHIPNEYRVAGQTEVHRFATVTQSFDMHDGDAAGDVTVAKGAASARQAMTGHAVGGNLQAITTPEQARDRVIDNGGSSGSRKDMLKVSLTQMMNMRDRGDLTGARLLANAIRDQQFQIYVFLRNARNASGGADDVNITIWGTRSHVIPTHRMNAGTGTASYPFRILANNIFDWPGFFRNAIGFHANVNGQEYVARMDWPWEGFSSPVDMYPLTPGHYQVASHIADQEHEGTTV